MQAEASVEMNRPIEEVFDFTNAYVAEWSVTVVEDAVIEETPDRVGTTFKCLTQSQGKEIEFQGVVTRWERPHVSVSELVGDSFDIKVSYFFEKTPEGTRVTQKSIVSPKGFLKVFFFLFGWMMVSPTATKPEKNLRT
jgi:hypothetical protein